MQNTIAPVSPPAPTAPVESRPSPRTPASHAFATLLRQSQTAAPAPPRTDPVKPAKQDGASRAEAASAAAPAPGSNAATTAEARRADEAQSQDRRDDAKRADSGADDRTAGGDAAATSPSKDDPSSSSDRGGTGVPITHGLVALHRPIAAAAEGIATGRAAGATRAATTGAGGRVDADADASVEPGSSSSPGGARAARSAVADERSDEPQSLARKATGLSEKVADIVIDTPRFGKPTPIAPDAQRIESASHTATFAAPGPASTSPTGSIDASVTTPLASPDFAQAFAVRVSVLVQDGVQRAELHLNPVETGPVSVQIVVDGHQARIDFGADALATRQAIEASLPELAGALREAGMTLQGGGVSQHARDPNAPAKPDGAPVAARGTLRVEGDARPAQVVHRRTVAAGGVDLYA